MYIKLGFKWRSLLKSNYLENQFSEIPNGIQVHDLKEHQLDALTTEIWTTYVEPGRKVL